VALRWLAGGQVPAYRAIAKFRKRHLLVLGNLFVQALEVCQAVWMVKLGRVALDGTKVRVCVSRSRAAGLLHRLAMRQARQLEGVAELAAFPDPELLTEQQV